MTSRPRKSITARAPQEEISRVAIAVYEIQFRGIKALDFKPRDGTVMHDLWKAGKLELRHQRAWSKFVDDVRGMEGDSGKVTGSYAQAVQSSGYNDEVRATTNAAYDRVTYLADIFLDRQKERPLLVSLMFDEVQSQGILQLTRIGFQLNGYRDPAQARAAGIANVTCLMSRVAQFYGV